MTYSIKQLSVWGFAGLLICFLTLPTACKRATELREEVILERVAEMPAPSDVAGEVEVPEEPTPEEPTAEEPGPPIYQFAYVSNQDGLLNIYLSSTAEGPETSRITENRDRDSNVGYEDLSINHDGSKIAHTQISIHVEDRPGGIGPVPVFMWDINHGPIGGPYRTIEVTSGDMNAYSPDWAHDRDNLAFVIREEGSRYIATTIDLNADSVSFGERIQVFEHSTDRMKGIRNIIWDPAFRPSAETTGTEHFLSYLVGATSETRGWFDIFASNRTNVGYDQARLFGPAEFDRYDVTVSPRGDKIAFVENVLAGADHREIKRIKICDLVHDENGIASSDSETCRFLSGVDDGLDESPCFTYDGQNILYSSVVGREGKRDILMGRVAGPEEPPVNLTNSLDDDDYHPACFQNAPEF